jgi:hypothetical protein
MSPRLSVPDGTDVRAVLEDGGVEYLSASDSRAVVVLGEAVLWVDTPTGSLGAASEVEATPVDPADETPATDRLLGLFEAADGAGDR